MTDSWIENQEGDEDPSTEPVRCVREVSAPQAHPVLRGFKTLNRLCTSGLADCMSVKVIPDYSHMRSSGPPDEYDLIVKFRVRRLTMQENNEIVSLTRDA